MTDDIFVQLEAVFLALLLLIQANLTSIIWADLKIFFCEFKATYFII